MMLPIANNSKRAYLERLRRHTSIAVKITVAIIAIANVVVLLTWVTTTDETTLRSTAAPEEDVTARWHLPIARSDAEAFLQLPELACESLAKCPDPREDPRFLDLHPVRMGQVRTIPYDA